MESCAAVDKELERVLNKFQNLQNNSDKIFKDAITPIQELIDALDDGMGMKELEKVTPEQIAVLKDAVARAKEKLHNLTISHRDLHGTVSKVGKAIDRNFVSDFATTSTTLDVFAKQHNIELLNKIIAQHFYRQGMDDVADTLIKESGLVLEEVANEPYAELHRIWESIHSRDLKPALDWVTNHSNELTEKHSSIEFKLHRLAFMQILCQGIHSQTEAVTYARTYFSKFVDRFEKKIQILMGTLMYLPNGIQNSPYRHLVAPAMWIKTADVFLKDACNLLGINKDSPLSVVVNTGCTALPALLNIKQVMLNRHVLNIWSQRDELPIEIDLDPDNRYHSIFSCPILRQQSSEENPPVKLTCNHVISQDALFKLSNGLLLKCPYCPMEQSRDDAKLIYF